MLVPVEPVPVVPVEIGSTVTVVFGLSVVGTLEEFDEGYVKV